MNNRLYRKCLKKGFKPSHVAEVGVYHPETSNILGFINDGSRASLFEPNPGCVEKIKAYFQDYNNVEVFPFAITDYDGKASLYQVGASSFLSDVQKSPARINDKYIPSNSDKVEVDARKFNEFDNGDIDLLSVDTEGGEWHVIKNMVSLPMVISIETNAGDYVNPFLNEIIDWLSEKGYCIWFSNKSDTVFLKNNAIRLSFPEKLSARLHANKLYSGRLAPGVSDDAVTHYSKGGFKKEFDEKLTSCPLCDSSDIGYYYKDCYGIIIDSCKACDAKFMNPQYSDVYLQKYYSNYTNDKCTENRLISVGYLYDYYFSLIEKFSSGHKGKLLDIGCGDGLLLDIANNRGWSIEGYDVDPDTAGRVEKNIGAIVRSGDFFDIDWPQNYYSLITMHQVLEHLKDPQAYLKAIFKLLKNNGLLFIASPNISSLSSRIKFGLEKIGLRKKNVGTYFDTDHHIIYINPIVLSSLLKRLGFEVLYIRNGHSVKAGESRFKRYIKRNLIERLWWKSVFIMVARKRECR